MQFGINRCQNFPTLHRILRASQGFVCREEEEEEERL